MQKHFLRLHDFGQNTFWQIIQEIVDINTEKNKENGKAGLLQTWSSALESTTAHVWIGSKTPEETPIILGYLKKFNIQTIVHDCSKMETEELEKLTTSADSLNIACGFSESQLFILTQNTPENAHVVWLNAISERAAHFQAMAEVAFLVERCKNLSIPMDTFRICWLGRVSPLAQSLMSACIYAPFELFMGIPPWGDPEYVSTDLALKGGAKIFMTREPRLALDDSHIIYMDKDLEELAQKSLESEKRVKRLVPITGSGDEDFDWSQGLVLDEKHKAYATKEAPILYSNVETDNSTCELHTRRKQLHEDMFLAILYYVSRVL